MNDAQQAVYDSLSPRRKRFNDRASCFFMLAFVAAFIASVVGSFQSCRNDAKRDQAESERRAVKTQLFDQYYQPAKNLVRGYLKAPSTAHFSTIDIDPEAKLIQNGRLFTATGYVDAQNSFGVPIRYEWAVTWDGQKPVFVRIGDKIINPN